MKREEVNLNIFLIAENVVSSSPQPVANKKKIFLSAYEKKMKKKAKAKKINEPIENGKIDSEESPVTDKNEMVLEKTVSDNEINNEKPKKKKKLKVNKIDSFM